MKFLVVLLLGAILTILIVLVLLTVWQPDWTHTKVGDQQLEKSDTEVPQTWWKALPSNPWTLDKTKPEGHKQPIRPHGRLTPHYYDSPQKAA